MWKYLVLFIIVSIVLVGCNVNSTNQNYDEKAIDRAKDTVESYLKNNYENINKVEFSDDTSDPMGGLMIRGTVNGEAGFSVSIDPENYIVNSLAEKKDFPRRKKECKERSCDY
ncbi:DUF1433 domain-containing protein [Virgibacillus salexigens]|uniref:DUF1433 domain-containing protein n=1 Tax=Virgibacillus massiliensis TaxID=1462526 RepID=A0A024QBY2_9BACI|nr:MULTISPECIES: DUF1433 domain-containing protein [Virgibacillus]CDQ39974.1 hypothetical protein BN990_02292 [Virgibacillus massiliensis]